LKVGVNVSSKNMKQKILEKNLFLFGILKATDERAGPGSGFVYQGYGSVDPEPNQNVMDPQHC
jgi:hypothetical protein